MNIRLLENEINVETIPAERNYWFIRTYGGEVYEDFYRKGYIGVGLNSITLGMMKDFKDSSNEISYAPLAKQIAKNIDSTPGEATKWTKQLIAFCHEMKPGDVVLIPDKNSSELAIGIVSGDVYQAADNRTFTHREEKEPFPHKRRKVEWTKVVPKSFYQGDLRNLITSQQAVTKANYYSETIESSINPLFIKDDKMVFVLELGTEEEINAFDLQRFLSGLTYFYKEFCKEFGYEENEELYIKIKLQSKGKAVLKALVYSAAIGIAGIISLSQDPEISYERGKMKAGAKGSVLERISDFFDRNEERRQRRIIFDDSIARLKAKPAIIADSPQDSTSQVKEAGKEKDGQRSGKGKQNKD